MDTRTEQQDKIVADYIAGKHERATLVLSTGFGKSKVALEIIKRTVFTHIYIVVNSSDLRDYSWKDEFKKWGRGSLLDNYVTIVTYQKLARSKHLSVKEGTFVIFDEVDFIADTDILSKVIHLFEGHTILGLTGFITDTKKQWFAANLPVLQTLTAASAQDQGLLNKLHFVFVKYSLSIDNSDITVHYKKYGEDKTFTQSENSAYDYQQKKYINLLKLKTKIENDFDRGIIDYEEYEKLIKSNDYKITYAIKNRSELLLKSLSTANVARKLLAHILKEPNNKVMVFSKRTAQSANVCGVDNVYNGTVHKKQAKERFDAFNAGELRVLGTCDKVNRGVNVDGLNTAVFETFYGSDTKGTQRFGRMMRLPPDEVATVYVLLPYYMREEKDGFYTVQPTQQVTWAESMLRSTDVKSSSVWDYRTTKENV